MPQPQPSTPSQPVAGHDEPRIVTPPLRNLDDPDASWGYDFIDFCAAIGWPLDRWQEGLAIRLGELLPDGTPRFRKALILVARQNGKTVFVRLLIAYWLFVERVDLVLLTSTDRSAAKRSWLKVIAMVEGSPLGAGLPARHTWLQLGEELFRTQHGSEFRFSATNRRAGRGDTVHRAAIDELREHRNRDAWDAVIPAMNAVPEGLAVCITNEGDDESIVLHEEYDAAEEAILTGSATSTFLAAWSAPADAAPDDPAALAAANPSLGDRIDLDTLLSQARVAVKAGGDTLARFRIEVLCQRVDTLDAAIDLDAWRACGTTDPLDLAEHRRSVVLCFDVAQDHTHATVVAAAHVDGVTHVEVVAAWDGDTARQELRKGLRELAAKIKPRAIVWFPGGPAAAVADSWQYRRIGAARLQEIRAEDVVRACMGMEEQVVAGQVSHPQDPLVNLQMRVTQRMPIGDGWRFVRRGARPIDAVYAAAGGIHVARTIPRLGPVS